MIYKGLCFKAFFINDKDVIKNYCAIHNIDEKLNWGSIVDINGKDLSYCYVKIFFVQAKWKNLIW